MHGEPRPLGFGDARTMGLLCLRVSCSVDLSENGAPKDKLLHQNKVNLNHRFWKILILNTLLDSQYFH